MILDEPIGELLKDLSAINLDGSEDLDEGLSVSQRQIRLLKQEEYVFQQIKASGQQYGFCCVDGGNQTIVNYGRLVVELNKVVKVDSFDGAATSRRGPYKFLSLTYILNHSVNTNIYHNELGLGFSPRALQPKQLLPQSETYILPGRARRVMEKMFAAHIISSENWKMIALDGSLGHANDKAEIDALERLLEEAKARGVVVAALVKRSSLMYQGKPLTHWVSLLARRKGLKHFYVEVGSAKRGENGFDTKLFVVKLNSLAKKAYLLELYGATDDDVVADVVYSLANNSNNVGLPGYPQALVLSDRYSHVHPEEAELVSIVLGKHVDELPLIGEAFAHQLLDLWG